MLAKILEMPGKCPQTLVERKKISLRAVEDWQREGGGRARGTVSGGSAYPRVAGVVVVGSVTG